jgi:hypothetical protein
MRAYQDVAEERTKAAPRRALAALVVTIGATVIPVVGLAGWGVPPDGPALLMIHVSALAPISADGEYTSVLVAVDNPGSATAEACTVNAYNRLPYSYAADETSALGKSEQFDVSPEGGRVFATSLYLPAMGGEALPGGGVRAPVSLHAECENAESPEHGWIMNVPFTMSASEAP